MKTPLQRLADARIRVVRAERFLREARAEEDRAETELAEARRAEHADTVRPPANTTVDLDGGWS